MKEENVNTLQRLTGFSRDQTYIEYEQLMMLGESSLVRRLMEAGIEASMHLTPGDALTCSRDAFKIRACRLIMKYGITDEWFSKSPKLYNSDVKQLMIDNQVKKYKATLVENSIPHL